MAAPTQTTSSVQQLADGSTTGVMVNPATDSAGAASKLGFFGTGPVAQATPGGDTHTPTAGSTTSVYVNTTFDGSTGSTAYTVGDIVKVLKGLGLLKA